MLFELVIDFFVRGGTSLVKAMSALFVPALFFFCLGFIIKRWTLFEDMRRAARESGLNLSIMTFNVVVLGPILVFTLQGLHEINHALGFHIVDMSVWLSLHPAFVILVAVFLGDFVGYLRHRLEHTALFWPAHAVHHSDTEMTWLTLMRFHPINRLTTLIIDNSVLLLLGFPPYALIANNIVRNNYGFLIHADLPWTYGKLSAVFVSPAMHRWHHSTDREAFDTNFATVFSVFDRAFGTYRVPGPCDVPLGVTDDMAPTLSGQLGYAFTRRAYKRLFSKRRETVHPAE